MFGNGKTFTDRKDAGIELGKLLEKDYKDRNVLVLGIPRGGVEVAYHVAKILNGDLSVVVSKKLPFPGQEELAFGAVTEDGSIFLSSLGHRLDEGTIEKVVKKQLEEIQRRIEEYREGKSLPDMSNRIVIIVDDGIATGSTLVSALKLCKARKASKIVVAAPVSGESFVPEIHDLADEVKIVEIPDNFYAVGQAYEDFHSFSDKEVTAFLMDFKKPYQ